MRWVWMLVMVQRCCREIPLDAALVNVESMLRAGASGGIAKLNARSGTPENWGVDCTSLSTANPELIMLRVSAYRQTGP